MRSDEAVSPAASVKRLRESSEDVIDLEKLTLTEKLKSLLDQVNTQTNKANQTIMSKEEEIREHCFSLRTKVDTQSEIMIEEIRQWNASKRDEIDKYEQQCLDKFNTYSFRSKSLYLKSLVADMNEQQKRIEQLIDDVSCDVQQINKLITDTMTKLQELKMEKAIVTKHKFNNNLLGLSVEAADHFKPGKYVALQTMSMPGFTKQVNNVRHAIPDFNEMLYCFINPCVDSYELIVLVRHKSNCTSFVKLDKHGTIISEKTTDLKFKYVTKIQTVKNWFVVQTYPDYQFKRFDYEFNELEMTYIKTDHARSKFTLNQKYMINLLTNPASCKTISFSSHDLATTPHTKPTHLMPKNVIEMLASDKYLYIWYGKKCEVVEMDFSKPSVFNNLAFDKVFHGTKLWGDKYIATFDPRTGKVSLFTQDKNVKFVKEYAISVDDDITKYRMSTDSSNALCFFNSQGDIYHNFF